tara:strand:+ start:121 stop:282 length:162 start_codon:yes stop_codon:yes gene_type:complete
LVIHYKLIDYKDGAPGAIRTPDLLNRNQMLYPAELRVPEGEEHHDACNPLKGQ